MRNVAIAILAVLSFLRGNVGMAADTLQSPLPVIDFKTTFPWLNWISTEARDREYPQGFLYKLLSVRLGETQTVEIVLLRQLHDGTKVVALHAKGPLANFETVGQSTVDKLASSLGISFQKIDLRDVRDFETLRARAGKYGWELDSESRGPENRN